MSCEITNGKQFVLSSRLSEFAVNVESVRLSAVSLGLLSPPVFTFQQPFLANTTQSTHELNVHSLSSKIFPIRTSIKQTPPVRILNDRIPRTVIDMTNNFEMFEPDDNHVTRAPKRFLFRRQQCSSYTL